MDRSRPITPLPQPRNANGNIRTVGVELEFGGLAPKAAAEIVAAVLSGRISERDPFRYSIATVHGTFTVELDTRWAHPEFVAAFAEDLPEDIRDDVANGVSLAAGSVLEGVFPVELVCPPIPHDQLWVLRPVSAALAEAGALGTAYSAFSRQSLHAHFVVTIGHDGAKTWMIAEIDVRPLLLENAFALGTHALVKLRRVIGSRVIEATTHAFLPTVAESPSTITRSAEGLGWNTEQRFVCTSCEQSWAAAIVPINQLERLQAAVTGLDEARRQIAMLRLIMSKDQLERAEKSHSEVIKIHRAA